MKTETITISAGQVEVGDTLTLTVIANSKHDDKYSARISFPFGWVALKPDEPVTVTRPVADPCPRGRMTLEDGMFCVAGSLIASMDREVINAYMREMAKRWNEIESRTTAEIERGQNGTD